MKCGFGLLELSSCLNLLILLHQYNCKMTKENKALQLYVLNIAMTWQSVDFFPSYHIDCGSLQLDLHVLPFSFLNLWPNQKLTITFLSVAWAQTQLSLALWHLTISLSYLSLCWIILKDQTTFRSSEHLCLKNIFRSFGLLLMGRGNRQRELVQCFQMMLWTKRCLTIVSFQKRNKWMYHSFDTFSFNYVYVFMH